MTRPMIHQRRAFNFGKLALGTGGSPRGPPFNATTFWMLPLSARRSDVHHVEVLYRQEPAFSALARLAARELAEGCFFGAGLAPVLAARASFSAAARCSARTLRSARALQWACIASSSLSVS